MEPSRNSGARGGQTAWVPMEPSPSTGPHAGMMHHRTVVVVLAAGAGTRFHGPDHKLSAKISSPDPALDPALDPATGGSVIERSLANALRADIGPVVVVTGAVADIVPARLRDAVIVQHNDRWNDGQITSLHAGIDAARAHGATSVVVGLADQPFIDPDAWRAVAETSGPIVVATYDGRRANPVKLDAEVWDLLPTTGDEGARSLMRVRPELVREVACSGSPADIDTTEDLRRWQNN